MKFLKKTFCITQEHFDLIELNAIENNVTNSEVMRMILNKIFKIKKIRTSSVKRGQRKEK